MYQALIVFHVVFALGIIGLVMMQQGRGADAGAAFGSGASGTVFGARGAASFLTRSTAVLALLFFLSSLLLAVIADRRQEAVGSDLMDEPGPVVERPESPPVNGDLPPVIDETVTVDEAADVPAPAAGGAETGESVPANAVPGSGAETGAVGAEGGQSDPIDAIQEEVTVEEIATPPGEGLVPEPVPTEDAPAEQQVR